MEHSKIIEQAGIDRYDMALARNDLLDAFADLEMTISRILRSCGIAPSNEPFGNRMKAFRSAEKTNLIAKANLGQRDQIADEIAMLLPIRADIVHSRLRASRVEGHVVCYFINSQEASSDYPSGRLLSIAQIQSLIERVIKLTERVGKLKLINPASSPPPPSPGAASAP